MSEPKYSMFCSRCGAQVPEENRFCPHCGTQMAASHPVPAFPGACLTIAVAIAAFTFGIIAAIAIPNLLDAIQRGKQKGTMADVKIQRDKQKGTMAEYPEYR